MELIPALKQMVITECNVKGLSARDLSDSEPIIGGGSLNLDSLDAVEIVAALERSFAIRLENAGDAREVFRSFAVMADFVRSHASEERLVAFLTSAGGVHDGGDGKES